MPKWFSRNSFNHFSCMLDFLQSFLLSFGGTLCIIFQSASYFRENVSTFKFNHEDGRVNRKSYLGVYEVVNGIPR